MATPPNSRASLLAPSSKNNPQNACWAFCLGQCPKTAKECNSLHILLNKGEAAVWDKWIEKLRAAGKSPPWESSHQADAAPSPEKKAKPKPKAKAVCRDYVKGDDKSCKYGDQCNFHHDK